MKKIPILYNLELIPPILMDVDLPTTKELLESYTTRKNRAWHALNKTIETDINNKRNNDEV